MQKQLPLDIRSWKVWLALVSLLAAGTFLPAKIAVTLTPSLKHRVYWLTRVPSHAHRGDYVLFHDSGHTARGGLKTTEELMKRVGCDEGDQLSVDLEKRFYCNGDYLVTAKERTIKGEPLQHFNYNGIVPKGSMFVMGDHRDSYDSRYFGFVGKDRITATALPLF